MLKNKRDFLLRDYQRNCSFSTFLEYKKTNAEFKLLVKSTKKKNWREFTDKLNHFTPAKEIFEKVRILNRSLTPHQDINFD